MYHMLVFGLRNTNRTAPTVWPFLPKHSDTNARQHKPHNLRGHVTCDVVSREFIPVPIFNVCAYRGKNTGDSHDPHSRSVISSARNTHHQPRSKQCLQNIKRKFASQQRTKMERTLRRIV